MTRVSNELHAATRSLESRYRSFGLNPLIGGLMDHPQKDRFDEPQFIHALQKAGFRIQSSRQMAELYLWVVATKA